MTVFTLPYEVAMDGSEGLLRCINTSDRTSYTVYQLTASSIGIEQNLIGVPVTIGVDFRTILQFSVIYPLDPRTGIPDIRGRTALRYVKLFYENATSFTVSVHSTGRTARTTTFTAADLSVPESGVLPISILSQNTETTITITADDAGSLGFSGYEWEGTLFTRAARR
ncbi:phage stabilization protein [Caudoviricetes sp.]|nr:phage stabilization protein [Caudoviricetes sp.]